MTLTLLWIRCCHCFRYSRELISMFPNKKPFLQSLRLFNKFPERKKNVTTPVFWILARIQLTIQFLEKFTNLYRLFVFIRDKYTQCNWPHAILHMLHFVNVPYEWRMQHLSWIVHPFVLNVVESIVLSITACKQTYIFCLHQCVSGLYMSVIILLFAWRNSVI